MLLVKLDIFEMLRVGSPYGLPPAQTMDRIGVKSRMLFAWQASSQERNKAVQQYDNTTELSRLPGSHNIN